jgi:hypothetical protein
MQPTSTNPRPGAATLRRRPRQAQLHLGDLRRRRLLDRVREFLRACGAETSHYESDMDGYIVTVRVPGWDRAHYARSLSQAAEIVAEHTADLTACGIQTLPWTTDEMRRRQITPQPHWPPPYNPTHHQHPTHPKP